MRFIREQGCAGIGVDDVLEHVSSRAAQACRMFRKELGQTILGAITAVRMQRVKQLLTETDLSLIDIADRAGFAYVEYLSTSFRRETDNPQLSLQVPQPPRPMIARRDIPTFTGLHN